MDKTYPTLYFVYFQGIIPRSANDKVTELFVPADEVEEAKAEAENIPSVEISEVDLQWVQVLGEGWASPLNGKLLKSAENLSIPDFFFFCATPLSFEQ